MKQTLCKHIEGKRKKTLSKYIFSNISQTSLMQLSSKLSITKALLAISFNIVEDKLGKYTTLRQMDWCWKTSRRIIIECSLPGGKESPLGHVLQFLPEWRGWWGTALTRKGGGRVGSKLQLLKAHWRNGATQTGHISSRARTKCDLQVPQIQGREQVARQQVCEWHRDYSGTQGKQTVMLCHCDKARVLGCINRAIMCEGHEIVLPIWSW